MIYSRSIARTILALAVVAGVLGGRPTRAQENPDAQAVALAAADKAWGEIVAERKKIKTLTGKDELVDQFRRIADSCALFAAVYPADPRASKARMYQVESLVEVHDRTGDGAVEKTILELTAAGSGDESRPREEQAQMFITHGTRSRTPKGASEEVRLQTLTDVLFDAQERFPNERSITRLMLWHAATLPKSKAEPILQFVLDGENSSDAQRDDAQLLLDRPQDIGQPVEIRFTALDGREVDLAAMRGKVVLVDFWATWCGPCVVELPTILKVYNEYHSRGFEIVAISLDNKKEALESFIAERQLPWPQAFDGKGWGTELARTYCVRSIPTTWLIGKDGNLADLNAGEKLAEKVKKLLEESAPASAPAEAKPQPMSETQKIERMLALLGESDAVFIRNGAEYDGQAAAAHLRMKWTSAGDRVKTAHEFIDALASQSSSSGKPYQIRMKDGATVPSGEWFKRLLAEIEGGK